MKELKGSNLIAKAKKDEERLRPGEALRKVIYLIPGWAGLSLITAEAFPSAAMQWWVMFLTGMTLSAAILALSAAKHGKWTIPAVLAAAILSGAVFHEPVFNGLKVLANDVLDVLPSVTGRIFLDHEVTSDQAIPALIILIVLSAVMFAASAKKGSWLPVLPLIVLWIAGTVFSVIPLGAGWALFAFGMVLIVSSGGDVSAKTVAGKVIAVACCGMLALGLSAALADADLSGVRDTAGQKMHSVIYDSGSNSMPEGRIADLGPWEKNDTPALSLKMDVPQKMYLRGHVYEVYTGTSWEKLPAEKLAESEALFYWLHKRDFYGQSQVAQAMSLAGTEDMNLLEVTNLSACSEQAYTPYAMIDTGKLDSDMIGDTGADSDLTEIVLYPGSVREWYETQHRLSETQNEDGTADYLRSEQSYAEYIKENDLQLTQESWNAMYRQLGDSSGARSLYEIQRIIRNYLEENLHYDENVYTTSGGGDFLHYVLEQSSGGGYSVHYATAATLLLRYFGVPARYVEGYYLSPEQAAAAEAGEPVVLTEENAHAWAELYLNGVGFIPFEVTPGYVDPEDLDPEVGKNGDAGGMNTYQSDSMSYILTEEPDPKDQELLPRMPLGTGAIVLIILGIILLALIAFIASRRMRLRRKLKEIEEAGDREAVAMRYGYAMALKERAEEIVLPEDTDAAGLNELAIFSDHEITAADRERMDTYALKVLDECRRKWTFSRKLGLRLFEGIY